MNRQNHRNRRKIDIGLRREMSTYLYSRFLALALSLKSILHSQVTPIPVYWAVFPYEMRLNVKKLAILPYVDREDPVFNLISTRTIAITRWSELVHSIIIPFHTIFLLSKYNLRNNRSKERKIKVLR